MASTTNHDETEQLVRRYFSIVADLGSSVSDLDSVLAPDAVFHELPNPISPAGATRDLEATRAGFAAGKERLSAQRIDIDEILVFGDRAVVRSRWEGEIGTTSIVAHMAGFVRVRDGRIVEHITYDCYEPFSL
jgi:ketosteroid isomerase-like protein